MRDRLVNPNGPIEVDVHLRPSDEEVARLSRPATVFPRDGFFWIIKVAIENDRKEREANEVEWLWRLYTEGSCVCHMDYGSPCTCEAQRMADERLREILGDDWHSECRERFVEPKHRGEPTEPVCSNPHCTLGYRHLGSPHQFGEALMVRQWIGAVVRSSIDERVWVAVLPDTDTHDGAMQASTSLRKCKAHVAKAWDKPDEVQWEASDDGAWDAYAEED